MNLELLQITLQRFRRPFNPCRSIYIPRCTMKESSYVKTKVEDSLGWKVIRLGEIVRREAQRV